MSGGMLEYGARGLDSPGLHREPENSFCLKKGVYQALSYHPGKMACCRLVLLGGPSCVPSPRMIVILYARDAITCWLGAISLRVSLALVSDMAGWFARMSAALP